MPEQSFTGHAARRHPRASFLERIAAGLFEAMTHGLYAEKLATSRGLLQRLDPRVKLISLLLLIVVTVSARSLPVVSALLAYACLLAWAPRVPLGTAILRVWPSLWLFTGVLAVPAIFLVPGDALYRPPVLGWNITFHGLHSAGLLIGRALTTASFAVLLVLCTPWPHVLKALRVPRVTSVFVVILGMTHRYIFLFLQIAHDCLKHGAAVWWASLAGAEPAASREPVRVYCWQKAFI